MDRTLELVSHSLLVRYELVLGSFEVHYQFVMSSLDGHIRRGFQRMCAYPRFNSFLQYGNGTSAQFVKLRLHYNELAQRTATVWRYLTFGDIRCYTLKKSDECDH